MQIAIYDREGQGQVAVQLIPVIKNEELTALLAQVAAVYQLSAAQLSRDFLAEKKEVLPLYKPNSDEMAFLIGLGETPDFRKVSYAFRSFGKKWLKKLPQSVLLQLNYSPWTATQLDILDAAVNGLMLSRYDIGVFKSTTSEKPIFQRKGAEILIDCPAAQADAALQAAQNSMRVASTQMRIFDLVNAPANKKTPQHLAEWALESAETFGFKAQVFDEQQLASMGMDALLAVNRGSEDPARFILLEYDGPDSASQPLIGLVGKGVTFDTGGISIKPSTNLEYMKSDMGGGAAVLGAVEAAARLKLPVRIVAAVPCTDNSVDARSIKPSDVIGSYSGKSIEIIDTDAEGRLLLADGISYLIRNYKPDYLLDLATLTGSAIRTLGYAAGALFSNNNELVQDLLQAGTSSGERLWQLPLWDDYKDALRSDVADVKNLGSRPMAGAITAAKFIEFFTEEHPRWAHLDIAGVAITDSEFSGQRASTAFGVRLLLEFFHTVQHRSKV